MAHLHSVYDTDAHFSINPITRQLRNEATSKTSLIQHDHNSERFTFEIPRWVEGHDMSLCNKITVHYINIDSVSKEFVKGRYEVDDMDISPESDDVVILSWLISGNATQLVGSLQFLIRFACVTGDEIVEYAWNTAVCNSISVSSGINADETFETDYVDVIEQWKVNLWTEFENEVRKEINNAASVIDEKIEQATTELKTPLVIKEHNKGDLFRWWFGTEEEYAQVKDNLPANTMCIITDGVSEAELRQAIQDGDNNVRVDLTNLIAQYGLGGSAVRNWDDVDNITENGWYKFHKEGGIVFDDVTYNYAYMRVDSYSSNHATQVVYVLNSNWLQNTYVRSKQNGNWTPWEKDILEKELKAARAEILAIVEGKDNAVREAVTMAFDSFGKTVAPSGYGLGVEGSLQNWSDVDTLVCNGWYRFNENIIISEKTYNYAYMRVDAYNDKHATQTLYLIADGKRYTLVRHLITGVWETEWSWVAAPMVVDVEYRTTELFTGKPVYTKRTEVVLPKGETMVSFNLSLGLATIVRHYARTKGSFLPFGGYTGTAWRECVVRDTGEGYFSCGEDALYTSDRLYVQVWYTKD